GWHVREFKGKGNVLVHCADVWRVRAQRAFLLGPGAQASVSLYGSEPAQHRVFAEEICAEELQEFTRGDLHDHYVWSESGPNDYLDCLVGCAVAAAYAGATIVGSRVAKPTGPRKAKPRRAVVSYVE
ncbi:MAG: hypothetical protein ABIH03_05915, partial [Pseudomonadota bacterium]